MTTTTDTRDLETGWRPETPEDDTMLRGFMLCHTDHWTETGRLMGGRLHATDAYVAVDHGRPMGLYNSVTLLQPLQGGELAVALDDIERFYDGHGHGEVLLWSPWSTPDLRGRGWQLEGHPPIVLRAPASVPPAPTPDEVHVQVVTDAAGLHEYCRVAVEGYPFPEVADPTSLLDPAVLDAPDTTFLVAHDTDGPVAIGSQLVRHGVNHLILAVTLPRARGRGIYDVIARRRVAAAPDLPAAAVVSDMSRPLLQRRLGFLPLTRMPLWTRSRP